VRPPISNCDPLDCLGLAWNIFGCTGSKKYDMKKLYAADQKSIQLKKE
jgi:hypothetical protein